MADILTQIQDELDMVPLPEPLDPNALTPQLLHQMQASLTYIKSRAPPAPIPGQPLLSTFAEHEAQSAAQAASQSQSTQTQTQPSQQPSQPPPPPSQEEFHRDLRELSRDLLLKEQQIEVLVASLPGLNASEKEQVERMKELERELEEIEGERVEAVREKERLVRRVEEKIMSVGGGRR